MLPRGVAARPAGSGRVTGCSQMKDGDEMTFAVILYVPGVRSEQHLTTQVMVDTPQPSGDPIRLAGVVAERWRDLNARASPDVMEALITSATQFVEDDGAGEPTWEDAAWQ